MAVAVRDTALLDAYGRKITQIAPAVARLLLVIDRDLADLGMRFNIECHECSEQAGRPVYVMPQQKDGRVQFVCPHHLRIADMQEIV